MYSYIYKTYTKDVFTRYIRKTYRYNIFTRHIYKTVDVPLRFRFYVLADSTAQELTQALFLLRRQSGDVPVQPGRNGGPQFVHLHPAYGHTNVLKCVESRRTTTTREWPGCEHRRCVAICQKSG